MIMGLLELGSCAWNSCPACAAFVGKNDYASALNVVPTLEFDECRHAVNRDSPNDDECRICSSGELQKDYVQLMRSFH